MELHKEIKRFMGHEAPTISSLCDMIAWHKGSPQPRILVPLKMTLRDSLGIVRSLVDPYEKKREFWLLQFSPIQISCCVLLINYW